MLALSGPRVVVYQTKVAVAVLADTSASLSADDLARESAIASEVERAHGRHWTKIMPFARGTRVAALDEKSKDGWHLRHTADAAGRGTDLERAIRDGAAALPAGMVPRLLLISDGNENLGSVARAIWQAQQLGFPSIRWRWPDVPSPACGWRASRFRGRYSAASVSPSTWRWKRRERPTPRWN